MAISNYRGFNLQSGGLDGSIWKVKIKNHVLQGSLTAVKKSIDWWCDTASIIDPKEFASLDKEHTQLVVFNQKFLTAIPLKTTLVNQTVGTVCLMENSLKAARLLFNDTSKLI